MGEKDFFEIHTDGASFNNGRKIAKLPQYSSSVGILSYNDLIVSSVSNFNPDTTNNYGEIYAIYKSLKFFVKKLERMKSVKPPYRINLYSDSLICVNGLNVWMKGWKKRSHNGIWYSSTGKVQNQEIFKLIDKILCRPDVNINIFHVIGHALDNNLSKKTLDKAKRTFKLSNKIDISDEELIRHFRYNTLCDEYAKRVLKLGGKKYYV